MRTTDEVVDHFLAAVKRTRSEVVDVVTKPGVIYVLFKDETFMTIHYGTPT